MADRWLDRPEPGPGTAQLSWHILMRDQPQVRALAAVARQRLSGISGLHVTPEQWLHVSILRVGLSTDLSAADIDAMAGRARQLLARVPPAACTVGQVLYHPEAVALGVSPAGALDAVAQAIRQAAPSSAALSTGVWIPHITLAYSTRDQPAGPIIAALGRELPACPVTIDRVHLVAQHGPERDWNWQPVAAASLGG